MALDPPEIQLRKILDKKERKLNGIFRTNVGRFIPNLARDLVVNRTRRGFGVKKSGGAQFKLPKLSTNYIKKRRKSPDLSPDTSPEKANNTFTGDLIDSLEVRLLSGSRFELRLPTQRARKINGYLVDMGRAWLNFSASETKKIRTAIRAVIRFVVK